MVESVNEVAFPNSRERCKVFLNSFCRQQLISAKLHFTARQKMAMYFCLVLIISVRF